MNSIARKLTDAQEEQEQIQLLQARARYYHDKFTDYGNESYKLRSLHYAAKAQALQDKYGEAQR